VNLLLPFNAMTSSFSHLYASSMSFMTQEKKLFLLISHKHSTFNYIIEYESLTVDTQLPLDIYSSYMHVQVGGSLI